MLLGAKRRSVRRLRQTDLASGVLESDLPAEFITQGPSFEVQL